jgi:tetratricopeptide (TPR) repeat protein
MATTATDTYSLGMLLYVLLTGRFPYPTDSGDDTETQRMICELDPVAPSRRLLSLAEDAALKIAGDAGTTPRALAQRLRGDLDTIITKALRKDPDRRYSTVEQLIADLQRYRDALPVMAQPPTTTYRMRKFVRRHKAGVIAASAIGVALLIVAGTAGYSAFKSVQQSRQVAAERDKAEQINDFLLSIFELSSPNETMGEELTTRELLDRSAERVRTQMAGQPERQALLMHSIAVVYTENSEFDNAKRLLEEARTLHRDNGNERSADYASSTELYAEIREIEGAFNEAEPMMRQAVDIRREIAAPKDLASSLLKLGRIQHKKGDVRDAESLYREALQIRRSLDDEDDETIANALSYLGSLLQQRNELAEAESLQREALAIPRSMVGDEHMIMIESHHNLGTVLMAQGNLDGARSHFEEALRVSTKLVPGGDQGVAFLYNGLGGVYERMGDLERSGENFRSGLDVLMRFFGDQHPNTGIVRGNLGRILVKQGQYVEGESLLRSGIATLSASVPNHRHLPRMQLFLGRSLARTGQYPEAEGLLRMAHARLDDANGSDHEFTRKAVRFLVDLYEDWGRPVEADAYRDRLDITG